jgi:hypothetical protein
MVITQPVLQWQGVEKRAMHFIAVQNVIGAVPAPGAPRSARHPSPATGHSAAPTSQ